MPRQLQGWVERLVGEMRGSGIKIEYANSKARLQELLDADFRGLVISMIHKFDGIRANSSTRANFFVLIDEAHRRGMRIIADLVSAGVCERHPNLMFNVIEFNSTARALYREARHATRDTMGTDAPRKPWRRSL